MADFGIGVAGSVAVEVAKAIIKYAQEIHINKQQAKVLAQRCLDTSTKYETILEDAKLNGLKKGISYDAISKEYSEFKSVLDQLRSKMEEWSKLDMWDRIFQKSAIEEDLGSYYRKVDDALNFFQTATSLQSISTTNSLREEFLNARADDKQRDAEWMEYAKRTLVLLQELKTDVRELRVSTQRLTLQNLCLLDPENDGESPTLEARRELRNVLNAYTGEYPPIGIDSSELTITFGDAVHTGQNSVIYQGVRRGAMVAIKNLHFDLTADKVENVIRRIRHETDLWSRLRHPNITKFLGCCHPYGELPFLVSPWMKNGDVRNYLRKHPQSDALKCKPSPRLLHAQLIYYATTSVDVAKGLEYLHHHPSSPIVHGSLRGTHVLLDDDLNACLSDFGISHLVNAEYSGSRPPKVAWSSPEVLKGGNPTPESDIYSFGSVALELLTCRGPFYYEKNPYRLRTIIGAGRIPNFPKSSPGTSTPIRGLPDENCRLWRLMVQCWKLNPAERPTIRSVVEETESIWQDVLDAEKRWGDALTEEV